MAKRILENRAHGVKVLSTKKVYDGPVFQVFSDWVREGAHSGQRDVVRHAGSVVILAADEHTNQGRKSVEIPGAKSGGQSNVPRVLLVRQYRYAANARLWELPAGRIDARENKLAAAKRELREETGIVAQQWKHALRFYVSPGFLDETMDVYLATSLTRGKAQPEDDEQIALRFFPLPAALEMVMNKKICDAKTIAALFWYEKFVQLPRNR